MRLAAAMVLLASAAAMSAGEFNPTLKPGDAAPAWVDLPGVDGKKHSLADLKDKDVVVVCFTCNSCPVAVDYEDRIIAFAKKFAGADSKAAFVAINVNTIEEDQLPAMKIKAKEKGFTFDYLYDESQKIGKAYGATYTPEFFVLDKSRRIVYLGAMDDQNVAEKVKVNFLEPAVAAALAGKKASPEETLGRGCMVRYNRERRKKK
jgi:peroxiredoxin